MSVLEIKNINKNFDKKSLAQLKDISFSLDKAEVLAMIGPSGTGKSTLLNIILGRVKACSGEIYFHDELMCTQDHVNEGFLSKFSFVPQTPTLDESLTIFENIRAPIQKHHDSEERVRDMIETFGLEYKDHKLPGDLSAGQLQRVEFAKALVSEPEVLLLDEPFSNLDQFLKDDVIDEIFPIFKERGITVVMVTHDLDEAYSVSDRVMLLAHGKIQQIGSARTLYERPSNVFTARFTGKINLVASNLLETKDESVVLKNKLGEFEVKKGTFEIKQFTYLAIRPEKVHLVQQGGIAGRIKKIIYRGDHQYLYIQTTEQNKLIASVAGEDVYKENQQVRLEIPENDAFILPI